MQLPGKTQEITRRQISLVGDLANFTILSDGTQWPENILESVATEINRIENLLVGADNAIRKINAQAGIQPVKVDKEVYDLISRIIHMMELADDTFKLATCFKNKTTSYAAQHFTGLTDEKNIHPCNTQLYQYIEINKPDQTIFLKEKRWWLNVGAVAKAYATERAKYILLQNGIISGVIKTSGTITTWGKRPNGKPWTTNTVGHASSNYPFSTINISDKTIAGTDIYQCQPIIDRQRNLKIAAPKKITGKINSITLVCASAEMACVLQPFLFTIGLQNSLQFINQLQSVSGIFTDEQSVIHLSNHLNFAKERLTVACVKQPSQPNHSQNHTSQLSL
jgi:thiamine biosynthesis lipoprotein